MDGGTVSFVYGEVPASLRVMEAGASIYTQSALPRQRGTNRRLRLPAAWPRRGSIDEGSIPVDEHEGGNGLNTVFYNRGILELLLRI